MQPFPFQFAFDAAGDPDTITLPATLPRNIRKIVLKPPVGRAWTYYGAGATGHALAVDESITLTRGVGEPPFEPGEDIGRAALDTGSGNGRGLAT